MVPGMASWRFVFNHLQKLEDTGSLKPPLNVSIHAWSFFKMAPEKRWRTYMDTLIYSLIWFRPVFRDKHVVFRPSIFFSGSCSTKITYNEITIPCRLTPSRFDNSHQLCISAKVATCAWVFSGQNFRPNPKGKHLLPVGKEIRLGGPDAWKKKPNRDDEKRWVEVVTT